MEFVGFCGRWKTRKKEKTLGAGMTTSNKLNPYVASTLGIKLGLHWLEASALTNAPASLLPASNFLGTSYLLTVQLKD